MRARAPSCAFDQSACEAMTVPATANGYPKTGYVNNVEIGEEKNQADYYDKAPSAHFPTG